MSAGKKRSWRGALNSRLKSLRRSCEAGMPSSRWVTSARSSLNIASVGVQEALPLHHEGPQLRAPALLGQLDVGAVPQLARQPLRHRLLLRQDGVEHRLLDLGPCLLDLRPATGVLLVRHDQVQLLVGNWLLHPRQPHRRLQGGVLRAVVELDGGLGEVLAGQVRLEVLAGPPLVGGDSRLLRRLAEAGDGLLREQPVVAQVGLGLDARLADGGGVPLERLLDEDAAPRPRRGARRADRARRPA